MKTKSLILLSTFVLSTTLLLILSSGCKKDLNTLDFKPNVEDEKTWAKSVDGVLHFSCSDSFFSTLEKLSEMLDEERDAWEEKIGFVSQRRIFNTLDDKIVEIESESEYLSIYDQYSDIALLADGYIIPRISSFTYRMIVGREGIYWVGEVASLVLEDEVISSKNVNELFEYLAGASEITNNKNVTRVKYFYDNAQKSGCGLVRTAHANTSERKIDATMTLTMISSKVSDWRTDYRYVVESHTKSYRWKWRPFTYYWGETKTTAQFKNLGFRVMAPVVIAYDGQNSVYFMTEQDIWESSGVNNLERVNHYWNHFIGSVVTHTNPTQPPYPEGFVRVRGEFKQQPMPDNCWASILCGSW